MSNTPNCEIPYVPEGTLDPAAGLNQSLNVIDALLQPRVISMLLYEPPATGADGDLYIVGEGASGAWAGKDDWLARYVLEGQTWQFYEPGVNVSFVANDEDGLFYIYDPLSSPPGWTQVEGAVQLGTFTKGAGWSSPTDVTIDASLAVEVSVLCPDAGEIESVTVLTTGGSGDCVIDIEKGTFAGYPTTSSITAAAKPTITGGVKYFDDVLSGWTKTIDAGDILKFQLESSSVFTGINIMLSIREVLAP